MENARKIATNTFSQVGAKFVIAALQVVIFRAITGYLGKVGYGQYTTVYEFAGYFTIAADFGLFTIGVARIAGKAKAEAERILGSIFTLRLVLIALVTTAAGIAAYALPTATPGMRWGVIVAALANGTYLAMLTLSSVLQVQLRMTRNAIDQVLGRVVMLIAVYAITQWFSGDRDLALLALFGAGLLGNLVSTLLTAWSIRGEARIRLSFDAATWRELLSSALPYGLSLVLGVVYLRIGTLVLSTMATNADVGLYGLGLKLYDLIVVFPFAFMNSVLPALARNLTNPKRLGELTQYSFEFLATIGFGALAGMAVIADGAVKFLAAGQDFRGAEASLRIMMIAMVLNFFVSLFSYLLLALHREKTILAVNAVAAAVSIGVNIAFVQLFAQPSLGTACAVLVPQAIVLAWTSTVALRSLKIRLSLAIPLRIMLAAALMSAALWWLDARVFHSLGTVTRLIIDVGVGGLLYGVLLLALQAIHPDALAVLRPRRKTTGPLTIGLDVRSYHGAKTGKEWYTVSILEALLRLDHTNKYILYTRYPLRVDHLPDNAEVRVLRVPIVLWHLAVAWDLRRRSVDVWLATASYIVPSLLLLRRVRCITVVHDLVAFLRTNRHKAKATWIERLTLRLALRNSDRIIAVSKTTAADLHHFFPWVAGRTVIVSEAARALFRLIDDEASIRTVQTRYHLPQKYLLFVGTLEPRKNLPRLIRAYATLPPELRARHALVIVGKKGWYYEEIFHTVQRLGLTDRVHFTGYVPDEDLPALLNGADLFVLPSLYEGFGLPLLEAFACGTPVVCSETPALVEVAGEGTLTFDPKDEAAIARVLVTALTDERLRAGMRIWGLERSASFTWDGAAARLHALLIEGITQTSVSVEDPASITASIPGSETGAS